ncbi:MAG: hypothetical protein HYX27_20845 [Acidobacteria bacterium]|nr:hypothetical protein [Acidobacteriota bacterium]
MPFRFAATNLGPLAQLAGGLALPASLQLTAEERHHIWTLVDPDQSPGNRNAWALLPATSNTPLPLVPRFENVDDWLPGMTVLFQRSSNISATVSAEVSALWTSIAAPLKTALTGDIGLDLDLGIQTRAEWHAAGDCWWSVQRPDAAPVLRVRLCSAKNAARSILVKANAAAGLDQATRNALAALFGQHRTQVLQYLRSGGWRALPKLPAPITKIQEFLDGWLALPAGTQAEQWRNPVSPLLAGLKQLIEGMMDATVANADQLTARLEFAAVRATEGKLEASLTALFDRRQCNAALLDASFDFAANPALHDIFHQTLDGDLRALLAHPASGVTLHNSTLTEDLSHRQTFAWRLPFLSGFRSSRDRLHTAMEALDDASGRIVRGHVRAEAERRTRQSAALVSIEAAFAAQFAGDLVVHNAASCTARFELVLKARRPAALEPLLKLYGAGPIPPGAPVCKLTVSLPPEATAEWMQPQDPCDISRRIQRLWRALLPASVSFDSLDPQSVAPLLVWAALPVSSAIRRNGKGLDLDRADAPYWDWTDAQLREAMVWNPRTRANLDTLLAALSSGSTADETRRSVSQPIGAAVFQSLLYVEAQIVDRVTATRKRFAASRLPPAETMRNVGGLLAGMADVFVHKMTSIYGPDTARALGPLLISAGSSYRPAAEVTWTP